MPDTLATAAAANHDRVAARAGTAAVTTTTVRFREVASGAVMGTAVGPFKLDIFHRLSRVACARDISEHHPDRPSATPSEDWYANAQGRYYPMRNAFEDNWADGRRSVYFALLLEGLAPPSYGAYTLVIDPSRLPTLDLACFPGNTAERYAPTGVLDSALCVSEIAPWVLRGDLLTIKHTGPLKDDSAEWPTMVCGATEFSEAVAIGMLPLTAIAEIRVDKLHHDRWTTLRRQRLNGLSLSGEEATQVEMLDLLCHWRDQFGARIVAV